MRVLGRADRQAKLRMLAESEGYESVDELLKAAAYDSVSPAICTASGCSYTAEMEPDQDRGYCEACGQQTVHSALILAGLI